MFTCIEQENKKTKEKKEKESDKHKTITEDNKTGIYIENKHFRMNQQQKRMIDRTFFLSFFLKYN